MSEEDLLSADSQQRMREDGQFSTGKTYPLFWLNPVGLLSQNPTGLIANMSDAEMEMSASEMMDMERKHTHKGNNFQTTFKQGVRVIKLFTFMLQRPLQHHRFCRPVKWPMKKCRGDFMRTNMSNCSSFYGYKDRRSTAFVLAWAAFGSAGRTSFFKEEKPVISVWICQAWINPT